jgi:hypothetical protein
MSIDERKRHALYERLDELLDGEHADTLMELLPPVGWADVVTKTDVAVLKGDLVALEQRMDLRFEAMDHRLVAMEARLRSDLRDELHAALRNQTWSIVGVLLVAVVVSEVLSRVG